jgi:small GTP-binding protein
MKYLTEPTIGIDFVSKNIVMEDKMVRVQLWDTAGQERFKSLIPSYLKDAHLAIVVFDLTSTSATTADPSSVESLNKWIDFVRDSGRAEIQIYVVGNKTDRENQISNEARKIAK